MRSRVYQADRKIWLPAWVRISKKFTLLCTFPHSYIYVIIPGGQQPAIFALSVHARLAFCTGIAVSVVLRLSAEGLYKDDHHVYTVLHAHPHAAFLSFLQALRPLYIYSLLAPPLPYTSSSPGLSSHSHSMSAHFFAVHLVACTAGVSWICTRAWS